jgi:hypothetical protein
MMLRVISYWVLSGAKRRQIQQLRCCVLPTKLLKRRDVYLKLTRHNRRAGTHGTYNPKHNDRSFNLANSEHIDPERAKGNIYWDCFHGFRSALAQPDPDDLAATFSDVERQFYESRYSNFVESQNERNAKIRHTERNRSIPDLLSSRKTCPEETIYQLGTLDEHASAEDLLNIVTEFIEEFKAKFGDHVHVLDWALHLDESTPHIHERHVFDCENKYGEVAPQQEKALETLGFELPDPDKPLSRRNNRKITFDVACRKMLFEIAKRHGLELEEEAEYGNRQYLEKQDFILAKQKEQLAAQQNRLDELTLKVGDMETLLEDVSAAAYDKAVEVVTDVVRTETRKEDMRMIEDTRKWVLSPERKAPQATREYAAHRLDTVLDKFLKTMQTTAARLQNKLLKPEARQKGKEQVKEKARDSVLQLLNRLQAEQTQRTIQNCITILQNDHVLADAIRLNLLSERIDIVKPVGWPRSGKTLNDTDMKYILRRMEKYGISSEKKIESAIRIVANENRYHPIRDYLNGLQWDGTERIAHVLHHFLGAAEDKYTCEAMKIFLLGAIKRVFQPGCKFETMLCLVGGQGCGSPVATSKCCKHFEAPTEPTGETGKVHLFSAAGGQG